MPPSAPSSSPPPADSRARGVFCNRTLNLRSMAAIGYDMDYTLVHYHVKVWEQRAYEGTRDRLAEAGWPVGDLRFEPEGVIRGLILDLELGNIVKADRFGYVKRAMHGTRMLQFDEQRRLYQQAVVDLREPRWVFMNTLFSLSEAWIFAQLVELLDAHALPEVMGYADLHRRVKAALNETHMEGQLKAEIVAHPERFVDLDPLAPRALLDQRDAGKRLLLITNSGWPYTRDIMAYAFDPFLPAGTTWRDLFDLVVVSARKPHFFAGPNPMFRVVDEAGLLEPLSSQGIEAGGVYLGGDAAAVEAYLGVDGSRILYVGDHIYTDVHVSKSAHRWRTALVLRELEAEIAAMDAFAATQQELARGVEAKAELERQHARARLGLLRLAHRAPERGALREERERLWTEIQRVDQRLGPLAAAASRRSNERWGLLLRAGNDKSHLARQVERHADLYLSRVSNLAAATPFAFFRAPRSSLPHDG